VVVIKKGHFCNAEFAHDEFSFPDSNGLVFFQVSLAMQSCTFPGVLEMFQNNNALLEQIMKCLEAYLESKRVMFPRFYFLSNAELLGILAQVMCITGYFVCVCVCMCVCVCVRARVSVCVCFFYQF